MDGDRGENLAVPGLPNTHMPRHGTRSFLPSLRAAASCPFALQAYFGGAPGALVLLPAAVRPPEPSPLSACLGTWKALLSRRAGSAVAAPWPLQPEP